MSGKKKKNWRNYTVSLDEGPTEFVRAQMKLQGRSFSSFIDACCREYMEHIQGTSAELTKPLSELTLREVGKLLEHSARLVEGEVLRRD